MSELLTFSTQELFYFLLSISLLVLSIIGTRKWISKSISTSFDFNRHHFMVGAAVAVTSSIALINWETTTSVKQYRTGPLEDIFTMILDSPITHQKKVEKTPPIVKPPKKIIKTPDLTKIKLVDKLENKNESPVTLIDNDDIVDVPVVSADTSLAPMIVPKPQKEDAEEEFVFISEQMPRFPGCSSEYMNNREKEQCSKEKLLSFIYKTLKYPAVARENRIEGMVVIRFMITKEGKLTNIKLLRDIGAGCGKAAVKVVESMKELPDAWEPGRQRGQAVNVLYTLPVKFKLQ